MIASLKGVLDSVAEESAIVDVRGVGYLVFCSGRTLSKLPQPGEAVRFVVETHVREDHIHLYGFAESVERDWFRLLTTVQGVGAKVGLAILSALGPEELVQALVAQDKAAVSRANGVGPKLAGRIVLELKDKVSGLAPAAFERLSFSRKPSNWHLGGATGRSACAAPATRWRLWRRLSTSRMTTPRR